MDVGHFKQIFTGASEEQRYQPDANILNHKIQTNPPTMEEKNATFTLKAIKGAESGNIPVDIIKACPVECMELLQPILT